MVKVVINNLPAQDLEIMGLIPLSDKGQPGGIAELGDDGKVPMEQLPPIAAEIPTLEEIGAEPMGAEARAKAYAEQLIREIPPAPLPTPAEIGAEPVGAESRAKAYTDLKISGLPAPPTLQSLGAEPVGAESKAKAYTDLKIAALQSRLQTLERRHALRINCGNSPIYYGADGLWLADTYAPTSGTAVVKVSATFPANPPASGYSDPLILDTMRFGATFNYTIPICNGTHSVELLFCEPYFNNAGEKIFNVFLQGKQVLANFDILANAKKMEAVVRTFNNIVVTDNKLVIAFTSIKDQASISGIIVRLGL